MKKSIKAKIIGLLIILVVVSVSISAVHVLNIGNIHGIIEVSNPPILIDNIGIPIDVTHQLSLSVLENQTITEEVYNNGNACYQVEFLVENISEGLSLYITPKKANVMPGETIYVGFNYTAGLIYGTMHSNVSIIISACSYITITDAPITTPIFDITPSNGSYNPSGANVCPQIINEVEDGVVVQVSVDTDNNIFQANYTSFNFTVRPVPPLGAGTQDLATIYFSVYETTKYNGKYIFCESGGVYQALWAINDAEITVNYCGSHTMLMPDEHWLELRCELDGKGPGTFGDEFNSIGDLTTFNIDFWNADHTWTWTYTVTLLCVKTSL